MPGVELDSDQVHPQGSAPKKVTEKKIMSAATELERYVFVCLLILAHMCTLKKKNSVHTSS